MLGMVGHGPDPEKWPNRMQGEKAHPSAGVDRILMRMITFLSDVLRNVVNRNHAVREREDDKKENTESKVTETVHRVMTLQIKQHGVKKTKINFRVPIK